MDDESKVFRIFAPPWKMHIFNRNVVCLGVCCASFSAQLHFDATQILLVNCMFHQSSIDDEKPGILTRFRNVGKSFRNLY